MTTKNTTKSIITSLMMVEAEDKSMFLIDINLGCLPLQNQTPFIYYIIV